MDPKKVVTPVKAGGREIYHRLKTTGFRLSPSGA